MNKIFHIQLAPNYVCSRPASLAVVR